MKRLLPVVLLAAACAKHPTDTATATVSATATATATATAAATASATPPPMPAAALLWTADTPPEGNLDTRDGTLKKTPPPSADEVDQQTRIYPFEMDQYQITRTDLDTVLGPYVGRPIRVQGAFRKIFHSDDNSWTYEVDPARITLLK